MWKPKGVALIRGSALITGNMVYVFVSFQSFFIPETVTEKGSDERLFLKTGFFE